MLYMTSRTHQYPAHRRKMVLLKLQMWERCCMEMVGLSGSAGSAVRVLAGDGSASRTSTDEVRAVVVKVPLELA